MLFKIAVAILVAWFLGLVGLFNAGGLTHVPLLVGLIVLPVDLSGLELARRISNRALEATSTRRPPRSWRWKERPGKLSGRAIANHSEARHRTHEQLFSRSRTTTGCSV